MLLKMHEMMICRHKQRVSYFPLDGVRHPV